MLAIFLIFYSSKAALEKGFPKLYIYDLPAALSFDIWHAYYHSTLLSNPYGDLLDPLKSELVFEPLGVIGQLRASLYWWKRAIDYPWKTNDPAEADVFYLPFPIEEARRDCNFRLQFGMGKFANTNTIMRDHIRSFQAEDDSHDIAYCSRSKRLLLLEMNTWLKENDVFQYWKNRKPHVIVLAQEYFKYLKIYDGRRKSRMMWMNDFVKLSVMSNLPGNVSNYGIECQVSIPYPTEIHFRDSNDIIQWTSDLPLASDRKFLLGNCFGRKGYVWGVGRSIAWEIGIDNPDKVFNAETRFLEHENAGGNCPNVYRQSTFCFSDGLDTPVRKGMFEAWLYGCIPVFTHWEAVFNQWEPLELKQGVDYVLIDLGNFDNLLKEHSLVKEVMWAVLSSYTTKEMDDMQKSILRKISRFQWASGYSLLDSQPDVFLSTLQYIANPNWANCVDVKSPNPVQIQPGGTIPRIFHFIWISPYLNGTQDISRLEIGADWAKLHPEWEVKIWTNELLKQEANKWSDPEFFDLLELLSKMNKMSWMANLIRYKILWLYGGVYLDTDIKAMRNINGLISKSKGFSVCEEPRVSLEDGVKCEKVCNAVIGVPRHHPALIVTFRKAVVGTKARMASHPNGRYLLHISGPPLWSKQVKKYKVEVLNAISFYPCDWRETEKCIPDNFRDNRNVYAMHMWAKSWWGSA